MPQINDDIAIRVEHLGKRYRIGKRERYKTLRESMMGWLRPGANGDASDDVSTDFWALDDVSFDVKRGEVVGIIGRNGAGKSTLLKVLSRITEPTRGRVEITGRVGSLLEVGTGFHPELTGRENVFLNGAILGMREGEIRQKFDEIVAFAEVEQFIDTPVKRYSSGMYTRLAFAVAAHLNSDVLIIDEVLAVGDAEFQKKCIGKMQEVGQAGRTVLFVSHSMPTLLRLCPRLVLLNRGRLEADGPAYEISRTYMSAGALADSTRTWGASDAPGDAFAKLRSVRVVDSGGASADVFDIRKPIHVEVGYDDLTGTKPLTISLHVINEDGVTLFVSNDFTERQWYRAARQAGPVRARCAIPGNYLAEGRHFILVAICTYNPDAVHAIEQNAVSFQVADESEGDAVRGPFTRPWPGVVRPMLDWKVSNDPPRATSNPPGDAA